MRTTLRFWLAIALFAGTGVALAQQRLRIGAEDDWRPYSYVKEGKPQGFAVDLVRAAWAAAGVEVDLVPLPYARCRKEVDNGKLAGCFDTLRDAKTEPNYLWHKQPLFMGRIGIYARLDLPGGNAKATINTLRGARVGITNGYDYGEAFDNDATMRRVSAASDLISLRELAAGRIDYALVYDRVADQISAKYPDLGRKFAQRGVLVEPPLFIAFSPGYPGIGAIITRFDGGLQKIRKSGEYADIEARWK